MDGFAGLSFASGLATNYMNQSQNEQQRQFSRQMFKEQMEFNRQEAQIARQYNSIGAQKQRMLAAGFNPDLMYGMSTGLQTGQFGSSSLGSAPNVTPYQNPFGADMLNALSNERLASVQEDLVESQADLNRAKAQESRSTSELNSEYILNQEKVRVKLAKDVELSDAQISELKSQANKLDSEVNLINEQIKDVREVSRIHGEQAFQEFIRSTYFERQISESLANLRANTRNLDASSYYYKSLKNMTDQEFKEACESFVYRLAGYQKQFGDEGLLDKLIENYRLTNEGLDVDVEIKKATKDFTINTRSGALGYTSFVASEIIAPLLGAFFDFALGKGMLKGAGKALGRGSSSGSPSTSSVSPSPSSVPARTPSFNAFDAAGRPTSVNTTNPNSLTQKQREYLDKYYKRGWFIDSKGDIHSK